MIVSAALARRSPWTRLRRSALPSLLVACASVQSSTSSVLLMLALEVHDGDHVHAIAVVNADGHPHVVLGHAETSDLPDADPAHEHVASEASHVFHVTSDDASASAARRPGAAPASMVALPIALQTSGRALAHPRSGAPGRDPDSRPLVLRL